MCIKINNDLVYYCLVREEIDRKPWYNYVKLFIRSHEYLLGTSEQKNLEEIDNELFLRKRSNGTLLRCLDEREVKRPLE
jgi:hypothetical protein